MNAIDVKKVLLEKEVEYLYHVNTVATSLSYINNGGLFSRGAATNLNLLQTPQTSDASDIELGIFLMSFLIHVIYIVELKGSMIMVLLLSFLELMY